jgi:hypothetical protein
MMKSSLMTLCRFCYLRVLGGTTIIRCQSYDIEAGLCLIWNACL